MNGSEAERIEGQSTPTLEAAEVLIKGKGLIHPGWG
jgi:hypothetical protein